MRHTLSVTAALITLLCLMSIREGRAEEAPVKEAIVKLSGVTSRTWLLGDVKRFMGATDACSDSETDRFSSDHIVTINKCVDGKLVETTHPWAIHQEGGIDLVLSVEGVDYGLSFKDEGSKHFMRLRQRSSSKTTPTVDRTFRLSDD